MLVNKAYKFRIYPNKDQAILKSLMIEPLMCFFKNKKSTF
ncbi:helix-turn-helix domain-containing protein [Peribacillus loiseleuriae]